MSNLTSVGSRLAAIEAAKSEFYTTVFAEAAAKVEAFEATFEPEVSALLGEIEAALKSNEPTIQAEAKTLRKQYRKDKRNENNPIKNVNIGVAASYRHQKDAGRNAEDALAHVSRFAVEKATAAGLHAQSCSCKGQTEGCEADEPIFVTDYNSLPLGVQQKVDFLYKNYASVRPMTASTKKKGKTA